MIEVASQPALVTSRLRLRPVVAEDAEALHDCYGDPRVMRYWDFPPSRDIRQTASRLAQSLQIDPLWHQMWAILPRDRDRAIGMVNYHHRDPAAGRLEVGYVLARPNWRQGYMTEAMQAFLQYCFDELQTHRVEALVDQRNLDSIRFTQGLRFQAEGLLRDRDGVAGHRRSLWMFALLEEQWRAWGGRMTSR